MNTLRRRRSKFLGGMAILAIVFLLIPQVATGGELQSVRDEVRDPADRSISLGSGKCDHHCGNDWDGDGMCDDDPTSDFWAALVGYAVISPFIVPRCALDDVGETGYFPKYPYRKGEHFMMYEPAFSDWSQPRKGYSGRIRMEYCENYQDLWRAGGQIQFETVSRFGIDTEAHRFEERLGGGRTDYLWLGDCNFTYRFAQSERAAFRAGIGFNWLDDPIRTDYGFNFTYGFDLYPRKPWVFSTEFDIGTLGKSELVRVRTTAGIQIHRVETYVGYEYLNVAGTTFNGLIAGLRVSF